jgi:hypothetical protein
MPCIASIALCMGQNSHRRFFLTVKDQAGDLVDISDAQAITFTVWALSTPEEAGEQKFTKKLAASTIQINSPHQFNFLVAKTDSGIDPGTYDCEAWITNGAGEEQPVAKGTFEIEDTRQGDS